jgi:hypothetical protein
MKRRVIDYELLESEAARGRTVNQLMSMVGVSPGTWYKRMDDDPEFKAAYVRGRERNSGCEPAAVSVADATCDTVIYNTVDPETIEEEDDNETYDPAPEPSMREYILQAVGLGLHLPRQIAKDLSVPIYEVVRHADALVRAFEAGQTR